MKTILVAIDFSPVTDSVVAAAAELARSVQGRLFLLNVVPVPDLLGNVAIGINTAYIVGCRYQLAEAPDAAAVETEAERRADGRLKHLAWSLPGLDVGTSVAAGDPAEEILRVAREKSADFIMMGLHRHNSLYELFVGSTAHAVLKKAPCPVLMIPARPGA